MWERMKREEAQAAHSGEVAECEGRREGVSARVGWRMLGKLKSWLMVVGWWVTTGRVEGGEVEELPAWEELPASEELPARDGDGVWLAPKRWDRSGIATKVAAFPCWFVVGLVCGGMELV